MTVGQLGGKKNQSLALFMKSDHLSVLPPPERHRPHRVDHYEERDEQQVEQDDRARDYLQRDDKAEIFPQKKIKLYFSWKSLRRTDQ